jgi:glycosyltransferase involved in cell wall biosynthesis
MPLPLSICIPTYNRAPLLERTLTHLSQHTACFTEVVISDNASSDDTQAVIAAFRPKLPQLRYVRQSQNYGAMRNVSAAMMLASAEFCLVLSDDDAILPEGIELAVSTMAADDECVAVYGGYDRCDADLHATLMNILPPLPGRFAKADMESFAGNMNVLSFPVVRTKVVQRHCWIDQTTLGLTRLTTQLLDHGVVRVLSCTLYRHAETADRLELKMTEAWFHDSLRADWELFCASMGKLELYQVLNMVTNRTVPVYHQAQAYARSQNKPLEERTFLLRHLAYMRGRDWDAEIRIRDWERTRLIATAIVILRDRLDMAPGLKRVIVEAGEMNIMGMMRYVLEAAPQVTVVERSSADFSRLPVDDGDFLLAEYWETMAARAVSHVDDPARRFAVGDLIASLRISDSGAEPLLEGPDGSIHRSRL